MELKAQKKDQLEEQKKKLVVEQRVYRKAFLHACKYVADDLVGILVGKQDSEKKNQYTLVDAFPLFHSRILAPTLEVALTLIEQHIAKQNLKIVGIYETVSDYMKTEQVSEIGAHILEKIHESIKSEPVCLKIIEIVYNKQVKEEEKESKNLISEEKDSAEQKAPSEQQSDEKQDEVNEAEYDDDKEVRVLTYIPYHFTKVANDDFILRKIYDLEQPEKPFFSIENDIKQGLHRKIIDFDNHFEEISLDFTNQYLN